MAEEKDVKKEEQTPEEETKEESTQAEEATGEKKEEAEAPAQEEKKEEASDDTAKAEETTDDASDEEVVEVPKKFQKIVKEIEEMPVLELNELVKVFEKKFGVSAAAVAAAPGGGDGAGAAEEKSSFDVELTDMGGQKIQVIKAVKSLLGLGLKEAKDMVESAPTVLKEGVPKEEAEEIKTQIQGVGGTITLK